MKSVISDDIVCHLSLSVQWLAISSSAKKKYSLFVWYDLILTCHMGQPNENKGKLILSQGKPNFRAAFTMGKLVLSTE